MLFEVGFLLPLLVMLQTVMLMVARLAASLYEMDVTGGIVVTVQEVFDERLLDHLVDHVEVTTDVNRKRRRRQHGLPVSQNR